MGDLVVLTPSRSVARWARNVCLEVGPHGTRNRMLPINLWVSDKKVHCLLNEAYPRLAFFAAWAMHDRYGPRAQRVVEKALRITNLLPDGLRQRQAHAIFDVLNKRLRAEMKETPMLLNTKIPESPFLNQWLAELRVIAQAQAEAEIEAKTRRDALLTIFQARGLTVSPREKNRILKCADPATLHHWLAAAVHAPSVKQALASTPAQSPNRTSQPPAPKLLASNGAA